MGLCYASIGDCKEYVDTIMSDVVSVFDQNSIIYQIRNGGSEIFIKGSDRTIDELRNLIESSLEIPKIITSMLLTIKAAGKDIFIRLNYK